MKNEQDGGGEITGANGQAHVTESDNLIASVSDPFFRAAAARHVESYCEYFAERLDAVYVWGSVSRGEAVAGVSDLDLIAFISDPVSEVDQEWLRNRRPVLEAEFPKTRSLGRPFETEALLRGIRAGSTAGEQRRSEALVFRLASDATRLWGADLLLNPEMQATLRPASRELATGSFESARDLARWAAGQDDTNNTDFSLPEEPRARLRKLARVSVIAGGWYLVAEGRLLSLRGKQALPLLLMEFPEWRDFLEDTERWYVDLPTESEAEISLGDYTERVARWADLLGGTLGMDVSA